MVASTATSTWKAELLQGANAMGVAIVQTASGVTSAFTLTGMTSTAGIAVGMVPSGSANIASGAVVASIDSLTQVTLSKAHTGTITTASITFTGDVLKLCLLASGKTPNGATQSNAGTPGTSAQSVTNIGTDEVAASGTYSAGGNALTNTAPVQTNPITSAAWSYSNSLSWTGATLSVMGAYIYNTTVRLGHSTFALAANRVVAWYDFGGTVSVVAGTLTLTTPTQDGTTGLLRIT
jgi:hypothetical protein